MRKLFFILWVTAVLLPSRGHSATDATNDSLSFYIVSAEKIDGGRYIDTLDFPKVGYIAAKPDLVIVRLVAVSETVTHSSIVNIDKDGKQTETPLPDRPALDVKILPEDAQKFEALTKRAVGERVLLMLGDTPILAPTIHMPISTQSLHLTFAEHGNQKMIEDELKKLVH